MTERTRVLLYLLVATVVVAGCSEESVFLPPVVDDPPQALVVGETVAQSPCPPLSNVCSEMKSIVRQACPADSTYKNNGARNKCRKQAFNDAVKAYNHCFSQAEINTIRRCVFTAVPDGHGKGADDRFNEQSEPGE
jgi:hypothetical protein